VKNSKTRQAPTQALSRSEANICSLHRSGKLRIGHSSVATMHTQLPFDAAQIRKNRRVHRRLAKSSRKGLRTIWDAFRRFYHRARYPPYQPLRLRSHRRCSQSQSRLLTLPPEIRFMIWDHVMAGGPIALYQARDRITYNLMPEHSPQSVINITPQTVQEAVEGRINSKADRMHRPSFLSVLQTCQMM
jgi:hypothetical protein